MVRRGFTLIELLIVVSLIVLLAGMLLPAVTMVRTAANKAKCGNNMRNIAIAIIAYRSDNNDAFPGRC
jgi:prepilin-type N-terminal cleavage/methylation domain-containing protein